MSKPAMLDIARKGVELLGKKRLWLIPRRIRQQPPPLSAEAVREGLRCLGVFLSDEHFALLSRTYAAAEEAEFDVDRFLHDFPAAVLNPRRQHVVGLVVKKLDPDGTGLVRASRMDDCYDVLRHPAVLSGTRDADDVAAEFLDAFREEEDEAEAGQRHGGGGGGGACDDVVLTVEELTWYYCGLSQATPKDEDFELRCIRSFSLDRPKLCVDDEAARLLGSRAVSRQSRLLGEGRTHPLYTTTNSEYGSTVKNEPVVPTKYGRSQAFTRNQPPRSGGATSMNM